jgi:hypothetical protein
MVVKVSGEVTESKHLGNEFARRPPPVPLWNDPKVQFSVFGEQCPDDTSARFNDCDNRPSLALLKMLLTADLVPVRNESGLNCLITAARVKAHVKLSPLVLTCGH